MRTNVSALPPRSHLVRVLVGDGPEYDRMIAVTEEDEGATLFLQGWIGDLPGAKHWLEVRDEKFPAARRVRYYRKTAGREREVVIELPGP